VSRNVVVRVRDGEQAIIDTTTISSPQPGIEKVNSRRFEIDRLEPDEEININFRAYPKTLDEQSIEVAIVQYSSEQIEGTESNRVTANMSGSPALQLNSSEERNSQLESENQNLTQQVESIKLWRTLGIGLSGVGLVVAVGSVLGMFRWRNGSLDDQRDKIHSKLVSELDDIERNDGHAYEPARSMVKNISSRVLDRDLPDRHRPGFSSSRSSPEPGAEKSETESSFDSNDDGDEFGDLGGGFDDK